MSSTVARHPRFDLAHFTRIFPLDLLRREANAKARSFAVKDGRPDDELWILEIAPNTIADIGTHNAPPRSATNPRGDRMETRGERYSAHDERDERDEERELELDRERDRTPHPLRYEVDSPSVR